MYYLKDIEIDGNKYQIYYVYSKRIRRNIRFGFYPKENYFIIRCRYLTSKRFLDKFVDDNKESFIEIYNKNKNKINNINEYFLGEKIEDVIKENKYNLNLNGDFYVSNYELIYSIFLKFFNEETQRLNLSNKYKLKVKNNIKTYYGTNYYSKKIITLNSMLIHYDEKIIKSVIDHELAHDKIRNHSKEFYNLVLSYCPDYRILHNKLKLNEVK